MFAYQRQRKLQEYKRRANSSTNKRRTGKSDIADRFSSYPDRPGKKPTSTGQHLSLCLPISPTRFETMTTYLPMINWKAALQWQTLFSSS